MYGLSDMSLLIHILLIAIVVLVFRHFWQAGKGRASIDEVCQPYEEEMEEGFKKDFTIFQLRYLNFCDRIYSPLLYIALILLGFVATLSLIIEIISLFEE